MNTLGNTSEQDQTNEPSEEELNMLTGQETVKTGQDHLDETVYMGKTCLSNLHSDWNDITPFCQGKPHVAPALIISFVFPTNIVECSFIGCVICGEPFWSPVIAPVSPFSSWDLTSDSECFTRVYPGPVGLYSQNGRNRNCSQKILN